MSGRRRSESVWLAGVATLCILGLASGAQGAAAPSAKPHAPAKAAAKGLTGMWFLTPSEYERHEAMPLTDAGFKIQEANRKRREEQGVVLSDNNKKCLPIGMPTFMTNEFALEIIESPGRVTLLSENSSLPRSVYLDETVHTKGLEPSWNGHSIGHYEGKVLVIDTVNFNDRVGPIMTTGVHSPTTHLVERLYLKDPDTLVDEMTFEDPTYLTKPWVNVHSFHRLPPKSELWEYACEVDAAGWSERFGGDPEAKDLVKAAH
jgi:hypothetical protein